MAPWPPRTEDDSRTWLKHMWENPAKDAWYLYTTNAFYRSIMLWGARQPGEEALWTADLWCRVDLGLCADVIGRSTLFQSLDNCSLEFQWGLYRGLPQVLHWRWQTIVAKRLLDGGKSAILRSVVLAKWPTIVSNII